MITLEEMGKIAQHLGERDGHFFTDSELAALRRSVERGTPFGHADWVERTAERLGLESSLHPIGRPFNPGSGATEEGGLFAEKES